MYHTCLAHVRQGNPELKAHVVSPGEALLQFNVPATRSNDVSVDYDTFVGWYAQGLTHGHGL